MIVLDAYAVLAYLRDERAAEAVGDLLGTPTRLTAVNATEVPRNSGQPRLLDAGRGP